MLSRRGFLIATGAVALTGGGAAAGIESDRRLRHRVGLERSPDAHVPDAKVPRRSGTLQSRHMGRPVSWMLSTPRGPLLGAVVCLHGRNNTHRFAFNVIHLDDVAASLGLPIAVASVDGGADS